MGNTTKPRLLYVVSKLNPLTGTWSKRLETESIANAYQYHRDLVSLGYFAQITVSEIEVSDDD